MTDIKDKLDGVIQDIIDDPDLSREQVKDIISIFKNLDRDMIPIFELLETLINEYNLACNRGRAIKKLLEFYGFNNKDILRCRQKFFIEDGKLSKRPFLKKKQKECINILLKEHGVI